MKNLVITKNALSLIKENKLAMAFWGALLLFLSAQISIPLEPVPITLQSMGVLLIGLTFNKNDAVRSVIAYITMGIIGLPMFSEFSSGLTELTGATGGYIIGFLFAVMVMNFLKEKFNSFNLQAIILYCVAGNATIFLSGIGWLSNFIGFKNAIYFGFLPFIVPGIAKLLLLSLAVKYISIKKY